MTYQFISTVFGFGHPVKDAAYARNNTHTHKTKNPILRKNDKKNAGSELIFV